MGKMFLASLLFFILSILTALKKSTLAAEVAVDRKYFYVGGKYVDNGEGEHILKDQMYVEHLTPLSGSGKQYPIVFIHGQGQTGTNWLNKPDGSNGWASYFISRGYECYIVDMTRRGRSPSDPGNGTMGVLSAETIQKFFTASAKYGSWPQAGLHTQWPGSGVMGDHIFDTYYASTVPWLTSEISQQSTMRTAGAALLDKIARPVILVAHSQAGGSTWPIADARPGLVHSIVAIEPSGPPFENTIIGSGPARPYGLTDIPLQYSPPVVDPQVDLVKQVVSSDPDNGSSCTIQADSSTPRHLPNLKMKVLVMTAESSFHALQDWCTVKYLRQAGVNVDHLQLAEAGIHGNGHMVFLEKNSDEIAAEILKWIEA